MEHSGFRTFKSVKNINRLFTNIDEKLYKDKEELKAFIWLISFFSKKWIDGVVNTDLIIENAKTQPEWDNIKSGIIKSCLADRHIISEPEAKMLFDYISEALQFGYLMAVKNEYEDLLMEINFDKPGAFKTLAERLFNIAHSLIDIKHNTNFVSNKVTFNTGDPESVKAAIGATIDSLRSDNQGFKVGIRRWNSLLSPCYMNGRLYIYLGLPASFKSGILLKSALDIRKYNPGHQPRTPGMRPCVLYVTMENSFTETIERIWNMCFDDSIVDYQLDDAIRRLGAELGFDRIIDDSGHAWKRSDQSEEESDDTQKALISLGNLGEEEKDPNIEIVVKYFSYREICSDDLLTIIMDLRDEGMEVCALSFDYIKRIRPNVQALDSVKMELNRIVNELKAMAVSLDIPVITAHQMNRAAAATVDNALRAGKGDVTKLVGRENTGDAWEVMETGDWVCVLNIEEKLDPDGNVLRYLVMNVVKRRRVDSTAGELSKYTYLAHPFARNNGLRLLDDVHLDKVLSLQSLVTDIEAIVPKEQINAVPRSKLELREFVEGDDELD
jgi:hypothetical protein